MDAKLASDPRVILREGINARDLSHNEIPEAIDAIAADMSFISLKLALPPALGLARKGAWIVTLVKPQFEVGRAKVGKGGIVRDAGAREAAVSAIAEWLPQSGWTVDGTMESPFPGGSGNLEYLLVAHRR
jgi:23S rRNA (cytidine1920-2'-O)/16S rRNA (cytidine1409-2'-O)-methyltransferase